MKIKRLTEKVSLSPQIAADEVAAIKEAGFRAIICNRPDGEGANQSNFREIEAAVQAVGIDARYVPVQSGMITDEDIAAFGTARNEIQHPVLAHRVEIASSC